MFLLSILATISILPAVPLKLKSPFWISSSESFKNLLAAMIAPTALYTLCNPSREMVKSVSPSGDSKVNVLSFREMFLAKYIGFSYFMPHSHSKVPQPEMSSFISMSLPHQHGLVDTLHGSSSSPKLIASPLKSISLNNPTIVGSSLL